MRSCNGFRRSSEQAERVILTAAAQRMRNRYYADLQMSSAPPRAVILPILWRTRFRGRLLGFAGDRKVPAAANSDEPEPEAEDRAGNRHLELGHIRRRFAKPNRPGPRFQRAFVCPRNGSFLTRRWREMDSNHRYPAKFFRPPVNPRANSPSAI
jgi:hypothetical protein